MTAATSPITCARQRTTSLGRPASHCWAASAAELQAATSSRWTPGAVRLRRLRATSINSSGVAIERHCLAISSKPALHQRGREDVDCGPPQHHVRARRLDLRRDRPCRRAGSTNGSSSSCRGASSSRSLRHSANIAIGTREARRAVVDRMHRAVAVSGRHDRRLVDAGAAVGPGKFMAAAQTVSSRACAGTRRSAPGRNGMTFSRRLSSNMAAPLVVAISLGTNILQGAWRAGGLRWLKMN